jgi:hypothetical protein
MASAVRPTIKIDWFADIVSWNSLIGVEVKIIGALA